MVFAFPEGDFPVLAGVAFRVLLGVNLHPLRPPRGDVLILEDHLLESRDDLWEPLQDLLEFCDPDLLDPLTVA